MPEFKRLAAHNSACNELFFIFQECEFNHPYGRILGTCGQLQRDFRNCIKEQRVIQQAENLRKSRERQQYLRETLASEEKQA